MTFAGEQTSHHCCRHQTDLSIIDLAENLVEQCRNRYRDRQPCYGANFFPFNCTTVGFSSSLVSFTIFLVARNSYEIKLRARSPASIWLALNLFYIMLSTKLNQPIASYAMRQNFYAMVAILLVPPSILVD